MLLVVTTARDLALCSSDAVRAPRRRDARRHAAGLAAARCTHGDARGLEVSPGGLLQNELVQRQIRDGLAQPAVLELKVLQALHLPSFQPAELLAPPIIHAIIEFRTLQTDAVSRTRNLQRADCHADRLGDLLTAYSALDQIPDLLEPFRREFDRPSISSRRLGLVLHVFSCGRRAPSHAQRARARLSQHDHPRTCKIYKC